MKLSRTSLIILLVTSSCVLPEDQQAGELEEVPAELLTTTTAVPTTLVPEPEESFELALFWHDENGVLVKVTQLLETPPTFTDALERLVLGPNTEEVLLDGAVITPRVGPALDPVARVGDNGVLLIRVADAFSFRDLQDQKIPITEELVCTLTGLDGIAAIRIEDSLGEIALTNIEASPIDAATQADFAECATPVEETAEGETSEDQEGG